MPEHECYSVQQAVSVVRHVIQDHAPRNFHLGEKSKPDKIAWIGCLLGWSFPQVYLDFIAIHDGAHAGLDYVMSFDDAFDVLSIHHREWHEHGAYWPVGRDGCGNYWVMNIHQQGDAPPGTVFWYDHEDVNDMSRLNSVFAADYPSFVASIFLRHCEQRCWDWQRSISDT